MKKPKTFCFTPSDYIEDTLSYYGYDTVEELIEAVAEHECTDDDAPSVCVNTHRKRTWNPWEPNMYPGLRVDLTTFSDWEEFDSFCQAANADEDKPLLIFTDPRNFPSQWLKTSGISIHHWQDIEDYVRLQDDYDREALDAYLEWNNYDGLAGFADAYQGRYRDEEEFARQLVDDCYDIGRMLGNLADYFDYGKFADDLFDTDYTMEGDGYVFRTC